MQRGAHDEDGVDGDEEEHRAHEQQPPRDVEQVAAGQVEARHVDPVAEQPEDLAWHIIYEEEDGAFFSAML